MQVRKTKRAGRVAPTPGADSMQTNHRKGKNGSAKAGNAVAPSGGIGFHLLGKGLRPITAFEAAMMTGQYDGATDLFDMIDTEEKQLQCIADLYAIVKAQPKYKKLKEPNNFKPDMPPSKVILWLLRKLGALAEGEQWTVDSYIEGKKTKYRFVVYKDYCGYDVKGPDRTNYSTFGGQPISKEAWDIIPLDFLPILLKKDRQLHDIIIDTLALVSKANKIPLWDEDGDYSECLDFAASSFVSDIVEAQARQYTTGSAAIYLALIKKRRRGITAAKLRALIVAYNDNSDRKKWAMSWARLGLHIAATRSTIDKYTYVPGYLKGNPLVPRRHYKIVWSRDESDPVNVRAISRMKKDWKEYGMYLPRTFTILKPAERPAKRGYDSFVPHLFTFMEKGARMFTSSYRDYYYGYRNSATITGTAQFHYMLDIMTAQGLITDSTLPI